MSAFKDKKERYLSEFTFKAFFKLWSHPNLYKQDGKELCDNLVVFSDKVIIFEIKDCKSLKRTPLNNWNKIDNKLYNYSDGVLHQAVRASNYIIKNKENIFEDPQCNNKFKIQIPEHFKIYRIAIVTGIEKSIQEYNETSNSLKIDTNLIETEPYKISNFYYKGQFVHIFDDNSLNTILSELDTISDFTDYLDYKEEIFLNGSVKAHSEADIAALYLISLADQEIHLITDCYEDNGINIRPDLWNIYKKTNYYLERKRFNSKSYLWDRLVNDLTDDSKEYLVPENKDFFEKQNNIITNIYEQEPTIRILASIPRRQRRILALEILHGLNNVKINHYLTFSFQYENSYICLSFIPMNNMRNETYKKYSLRVFELQFRILADNLSRAKGCENFISICIEKNYIQSDITPILIAFNIKNIDTKKLDIMKDKKHKIVNSFKPTSYFRKPLPKYITKEHPIN